MTIYQGDYSEAYPLVCMDESSKQLLSSKTGNISATATHSEYVDTEYVRQGTANLFLFFNPIEGWRRIEVTETRTAED